MTLLLGSRSILLAGLLLCSGVATAADYVPERHHWERRPPESLGLDAERLRSAIDFARQAAVVDPTDLHQVLQHTYRDTEPDYRILGPTRPRVASSGLLLRGGYIVAEWGDLERVDMTFSVTKSYLSTVAALALADGLIAAVDDRVGDYVHDGMFDSDHNAPITWHHLLNQTSNWAGTLWEIPDWADRPEGDDPQQWPNRPLREPGSHFKYNDVRVNLLAYALLNVYRQPLPVVLRERIMDPIGASTTWRWHGYENSWVNLDGLQMQSVSGGGHFGGGMFISTLDQARFGLLFLRRGTWGERRLLPDQWFEALRKPTPARQDYGYMWWLNTGRERLPAAPAESYWAAGFGGNYIWIDERHDLVLVMRWVPDLPGVVERVLAAIEAE